MGGVKISKSCLLKYTGKLGLQLEPAKKGSDYAIWSQLWRRHCQQTNITWYRPILAGRGGMTSFRIADQSCVRVPGTQWVRTCRRILKTQWIFIRAPTSMLTTDVPILCWSKNQKSCKIQILLVWKRESLFCTLPRPPWSELFQSESPFLEAWSLAGNLATSLWKMAPWLMLRKGMLSISRTVTLLRRITISMFHFS